MSKVTSKRQVTIPKSIAARYGIEPGDDIRFEAAGDIIRIVPPNSLPPNSDDEPLDLAARLRLFDQATERQAAREQAQEAQRAGSSGNQGGGSKSPPSPPGRGWVREELYTRGSD